MSCIRKEYLNAIEPQYENEDIVEDNFVDKAEDAVGGLLDGAKNLAGDLFTINADKNGGDEKERLTGDIG